MCEQDVKRKIGIPQIMPAQFDEDLMMHVRTGAPWAYRSWEPAQVSVVLGRSNQAAAEVHEAACASDQIPIVRRRGGGGTVVLAPGIVVISIAKQVRHQFHFQEYFGQINAYLMETLQTLNIHNLSQQGYSDVCLRDRKILGASMYRSKTLLFYTASLMVTNDLALIDRYLKYPSKEPDYRQGRSHQEFLTTLQREYPQITVDMVKQTLDACLPTRISRIE